MKFCARRRLHYPTVRTLFVYGIIIIILLIMLIASSITVTRHISRTIDFGLRDIGELATQAGYYTNVNVINKPDRTIAGFSIPGTSSKAIATYQGVIKAGLDFSEIQMDVNKQEKRVTLQMPPTRILSNEVDEKSCEIFDESNSIFNQISMNDMNESQAVMKQRASDQAIQNGILKAAKDNAEVLITTMFKNASGTEGYELVFNWKEAEANAQ